MSAFGTKVDQPPAAMDHGHELEQLRELGRPEYRVASSRAYNAEARERARQGCFEIFGRSVELVPPIDWAADPFGSRSWRYELHTLRFLDVLARLYLDEGDREALDQGLAVASDWIDANLSRGTGASEFAWYDMATGLRAPYLAFLLRVGAHEGLLRGDDGVHLLEAVRAHGVYLADDDNYAFEHNHGLFQDEGLLLTAAYLPVLAESEEWRAVAVSRCLRTLRATINWEEGVHLEHSPAYQCAIAKLVARLRELVGSNDHGLALLQTNLEDAAGWFLLADGMLAQLGDTDAQAPEEWVREASEGKRGLKLFPESGFAVVKDDRDASLAVAAGYHGHGHKHADELSFVFVDQGRVVLGDTGRYGYYEQDPPRIYARSARAHNVLLVDDDAFDWRNAEPYGSGILGGGEGDGWFAIAGCNPLLRPAGIEHRRLFLFRPSVALVTVDEVSARQPHSYTRLFHFGPGIEVEEGDGVLALAGGDKTWSFADWAEHGARRILRKAETEPTLAGWTFPSDREWVPVWTAELGTGGDRGRFATIIAGGEAGAAVRDVQRHGDRLVLSILLGGLEQDLVVTGERGRLRVEAVAS